MFIDSHSSFWRVGKDPVGYWLHVLKYPIVLVVGLVVGAVQTWRKKRLEKMAEGWPSVEGCVQYVKVDPIKDSVSFQATLEFSYFVGEYRSAKYTQVCDSEESANTFARTMKDRKVQVRYNPSSPDTCLLDESSIQQFIPHSSTSLADMPSIL